MQRLAGLTVQDHRLHTEKRTRCRAWFAFDGAGQRRQHVTTCFGLPVCVDDVTATLANHLVVPPPRFGIDGLSDGAQDPQARQVMVLHPLSAVNHQRPDGRRCRVELRHTPPLTQLPVSRWVRVHGHTLEHHGGGAVAERPVHDVGVPRDPPDVSHTGVDVARVEVKHVFERECRVEEVAGRRVSDTLGFASGARRVQHEEKVFAVHDLQRAVRPHAVQHLVTPHVTALDPVDGLTLVLEDDTRIDEWAFLEGLVHDVLEGDDLAATDALVSSYHDFAVCVDESVSKIGCREAGKHDAVDGAQPRTREHGVDGLGDHGHVNADGVVTTHPESFEHVSEFADPVEEGLVGDGLCVLGVVPLPNDGDALGSHLCPAVHTVVAYVEFSVDEPAHVALRVHVAALDFSKWV
mmetsp:Transcript_45400/g.112777  ORF Transcript_45400/g.112777 Transcript_45400/m.112777 type:complete len:407 (+) Transcript_45400:1071-2291(+)